MYFPVHRSIGEGEGETAPKGEAELRGCGAHACEKQAHQHRSPHSQAQSSGQEERPTLLVTASGSHLFFVLVLCVQKTLVWRPHPTSLGLAATRKLRNSDSLHDAQGEVEARHRADKTTNLSLSLSLLPSFLPRRARSRSRPETN